mmetsp:Transcript_29743/g.69160  ORF Transcript_29743/g.69160 Transcript_29743/m.69160 type:complete len:232 (+) Transcript_29743:463-1158(+)
MTGWSRCGRCRGLCRGRHSRRQRGCHRGRLCGRLCFGLRLRFGLSLALRLGLCLRLRLCLRLSLGFRLCLGFRLRLWLGHGHCGSVLEDPRLCDAAKERDALQGGVCLAVLGLKAVRDTPQRTDHVDEAVLLQAHPIWALEGPPKLHDSLVILRHCTHQLRDRGRLEVRRDVANADSILEAVRAEACLHDVSALHLRGRDVEGVLCTSRIDKAKGQPPIVNIARFHVERHG